MSDQWVAQVQDRKALFAVMCKVTVYYAVLISLVALCVRFIPGFVDGLPVGGVSELSGAADLEISQLEDALLSGDYEESDFQAANVSSPSDKFLFDDALSLFYAMLGCLLLMLPVSWVHRAINVDGDHDHSLDETTLVLPTVVAGIVMVVQHSLALAFSLAGIVAGVQFRRALSDTFDTLFIFVAIAVGIAGGIHALDIAAVITLFFSYTALCVCIFGDGLESQHAADQKRYKAHLKLEAAAAKQANVNANANTEENK
ncbi:MAG: hypothetical protein ACI9FR_000027 [Cryomorphaceae bacterium]|jgi:uncharacterized protein (DUF697 family)